MYSPNCETMPGIDSKSREATNLKNTFDYVKRHER